MIRIGDRVRLKYNDEQGIVVDKAGGLYRVWVNGEEGLVEPHKLDKLLDINIAIINRRDWDTIVRYIKAGYDNVYDSGHPTWPWILCATDDLDTGPGSDWLGVCRIAAMDFWKPEDFKEDVKGVSDEKIELETTKTNKANNEVDVIRTVAIGTTYFYFDWGVHPA